MSGAWCLAGRECHEKLSGARLVRVAMTVQQAARHTADGGAWRVEIGRSAELNALMRSWRNRLDPGKIPGLSQDGRRRRKVSQELLAQLVGVSTAWYARLERGERGNYSDALLDRAARVLQLSEDEHATLFRLAVGREPLLRPRVDPAVVDPTSRHFVEQQPFPACLTDGCWNVVAYNALMTELFPTFGCEHNLMRWVLTYRAAQLQLVDWETTWAPRMLGQLRLAVSRWPEDQRLADLAKEILSVSEFNRWLWRTRPKVNSHADGDRRRLHLPHDGGVQEVEISVLVPLRAEGMRVIIMMPVPRTADPWPYPLARPAGDLERDDGRGDGDVKRLDLVTHGNP